MSRLDIWNKATRRHYVRLTNIKDIGYIRSHCYSENIITERQLEELKTVKTPTDHNETLLMMLSGGSSESLKTFIRILRSVSTHRYDALANDLWEEAKKYDSSFENETLASTENPGNIPHQDSEFASGANAPDGPHQGDVTMSVNWLGLLGAVFMKVNHEDTCRALADQLLRQDPSFDAVDVIKEKGIQNPKMIASYVYRMWVTDSKPMDDAETERRLSKAFNAIQRSDLTKEMIQRKVEYLIDTDSS